VAKFMQCVYCIFSACTMSSLRKFTISSPYEFLVLIIIRSFVFVIVALKTLDISQGSVATHLRCGGIFSDSIVTRFLLILIVK